MSAQRRLGSHDGPDHYNSAYGPGPRRRSRVARRRHPVLWRLWQSLLIASIGVISVGAVMKAVPSLTTNTTAVTTTADITQVGTATTAKSASTATVVTGVPAGTATGDVLLTFVETRPGAKVTCSLGAELILDRSHGAGTQLAGCLTFVGQSVPATVRVSISPKNQAVALTMAFTGVDQGNPVDVRATSSSRTSPSVRMSGNDLVVFGLGSSGRAAVATAPPGALLRGTVNNSGHAQVAGATRSARQGTTAKAQWGLRPSSLPVAATVALRPAPSAPVSPVPSYLGRAWPDAQLPGRCRIRQPILAPASSGAPSSAPASSASSTPASTSTHDALRIFVRNRPVFTAGDLV